MVGGLRRVADQRADGPARRKDEVARDRWDRYLLPDPATGEIRPWQRATTLANRVADRWGLERWAQRGIALGLASDPHLVEAAREAAEADDPEVTKARIDDVLERAKEAGGLNTASKLGTLIHEYTEVVDTGGSLEQIPEQYRPDVQAYMDTMRNAGIQVEAVEDIVVNTHYDVAGTLDRLVRCRGEEDLVVLDIKTGKDPLGFGGLEIAAQFHIYASASHLYRDGELLPMPKVQQEWGIVAHIPAGEGGCALYRVDLALGRRVADLCKEVMRLKGLYAGSPYAPPSDDEVLLGARISWVRGRCLALPLEGRKMLASMWPKSVPKDPRSITADTEVDALAVVLDSVESQLGASFGASDPARVTTPGKAGAKDRQKRRSPRRKA